jgi:hypothetical protein
LDNDAKALGFIDAGIDTPNSMDKIGRLKTHKVDLINDPWPYENQAVGAIICVHFVLPKLIEFFAHSLKDGGFLLLESIDGRGGNYLELPPSGFVNELLSDDFIFRHYEERKVGPSTCDAVTVKLFAMKRRIDTTDAMR